MKTLRHSQTLRHRVVTDLEWRLRHGRLNAHMLGLEAAAHDAPVSADPVLNPVRQAIETLRVDRSRQAEPHLQRLAQLDARVADVQDQITRLDRRVADLGDSRSTDIAPRPRRRGAVALSVLMFALSTTILSWAQPVVAPAWLAAGVAILALATIGGALAGTALARDRRRVILCLITGGVGLLTTAAVFSDRLGVGPRDQIVLDAVLAWLLLLGAATVWGWQRAGLPLRELDQVRRERAARRNELEELRLGRPELLEPLRRLAREFDAYCEQVHAVMVHAVFDYTMAYAGERAGSDRKGAREQLAESIPVADAFRLPLLHPECDDASVVKQAEEPESTISS